MKKDRMILLFSLLIIAFGSCCMAQGYDFTGYKPDPGESDPYVVYHIKPLGMRNLSYQNSVFSMAALLSKNKGVIPGSSGYYLNRSKYSSDGVRLTVFLKGKDSEKEVSSWMNALAKDNVLKIIPYVSVPRNESVMTNSYQGNERSFRKFLSLYTPITIECMQHDFNQTQKEFTTLMKQGGMNIEFLENSAYFMSLSYDERSEFVRSLYFNRKWEHMVINFVLGGDEGQRPHE